MIEAVAQQAGSDTGRECEEGALKQAFDERRFNRSGIDSRWGNHPPGHRTLGNLQLEVLPGLHQSRQIGFGEAEPTLKIIVLFD